MTVSLTCQPSNKSMSTQNFVLITMHVTVIWHSPFARAIGGNFASALAIQHEVEQFHLQQNIIASSNTVSNTKRILKEWHLAIKCIITHFLYTIILNAALLQLHIFFKTALIHNSSNILRIWHKASRLFVDILLLASVFRLAPALKSTTVPVVLWCF